MKTSPKYAFLISKAGLSDLQNIDTDQISPIIPQLILEIVI